MVGQAEEDSGAGTRFGRFWSGCDAGSLAGEDGGQAHQVARDRMMPPLSGTGRMIATPAGSRLARK